MNTGAACIKRYIHTTLQAKAGISGVSEPLTAKPAAEAGKGGSAKDPCPRVIERFRELLGGARDLMREHQGQPTAPLEFNMNRDKNIKAVQKVNEIRGNPLDK